MRQQLLEPGDKPCEEVVDFGRCYNSRCANPGPTEASQHMLFWAGISPLSFVLLWWTVISAPKLDMVI